MKKFFISACIMSIFVFPITNQFNIDTSNLSFSKNNKKSSILNEFDNEYNLSYSINSGDSELDEEITYLSKKVTYLLLGEVNKTKETSEQHYKRYNEYLELRYNPEIPEDESTFTGLDEDSQEYIDDLVSGYTLPGMFNLLDEADIVYNSFGSIRVSKTDNEVISTVKLPNITMRQESLENPMEYESIQTNLILYYYFKELDGQYKLYYLMGETTDTLNEYFSNMEEAEDKSTMKIAPSYESNLSDIYDYSQLNAITEESINQIYNENSKNIVTLNSYYNNYNVASANGFFINDGLVITTWNFIEKSLMDAQYIAIKDNEGNSLEIDGIVTANPETDIAVIKLKNKTNTKVTLGDFDEIKIENPAIIVSSKTGVGMTVQKGIIVAVDGYIQTAIPLASTDEGSPLLNSKGQVIGLNTAKQVNTSISLAVNTEALNEIQNKFKSIDFNSLNVITFDKLKEQYYYIKSNDEIIENNIPSKRWDEYSKIGNLEEVINLKLVKANYEDGIMSLRYNNGISQYISSMQLATEFKNNLILDGYKEILNSSKKSIYENNKYQIILIEEFDYLIVVMVKL